MGTYEIHGNVIEKVGFPSGIIPEINMTLLTRDILLYKNSSRYSFVGQQLYSVEHF